MPFELAVPYGLDPDGAEVRPSDAHRGTAYVCPDSGCGGELIYRSGPLVQPHFAHKVASERCDFWHETEAHLRAKQLVVRLIAAGAPVELVRRCAECDGKVSQQLPRGIAAASLEYLLPSGLRADVALLGPGGAPRAIVEIYPTHAVDAEKAAALADLPWIELQAEELLEDSGRWRPLQDRFRPTRCSLCRFGGTRPFTGEGRLLVACPLPGAGEVAAVTGCPRCPYFIGVRGGGIFCFGNERGTR